MVLLQHQTQAGVPLSEVVARNIALACRNFQCCLQLFNARG